MKKILLLTIFTAFLFSQTDKSSYVIGGVTSFSSVTTTPDGGDAGDPVTLLVIAPYAGRFFMDNLMGQLGITFQSSDNGTTSSSAFAISPGARYYFMTNEKVAAFGQAAFQYWNNSDAKLTQTGFDVGVGADMFLTDHFALEGVFSFQSRSMSNDGTDVSSSTGLNFALGFNYFFFE